MVERKTSAGSAAKPERNKGYHELLGHFRRVRAYMQHFYIYGFYTREEFEGGSARSYDNERRRLEGWMGKYYGFRMTRSGKANFISFDSRSVRRNPLYRALKSKSFTPKSIVLHFLVLDVLRDGAERGVQEILHGCDERLQRSGHSFFYEENTLRDRLSEYEEKGLLSSRKVGRDRLYRMNDTTDVSALAPALAFFSENAPCGVVGSFLEDRLEETCESFRMKHHYIMQTFDSDLLCTLLDAMHDHREVLLIHMGRDGRQDTEQKVLPLYILRSVQDGRTYLVSWGCRVHNFVSCRLDRISAVHEVREAKGEAKPTKEELAQRQARRSGEFAALRAAFDLSRPNRWGASFNGRKPQHIEFTISVSPWEEHVRRRMYRECRGGQVEELDEGRALRFSAELYDPSEILPWIRTFTGRITSFSCENEYVANRFFDDMAQMVIVYEDTPETPADGEVQD